MNNNQNYSHTEFIASTFIAIIHTDLHDGTCKYKKRAMQTLGKEDLDKHLINCARTSRAEHHDHGIINMDGLCHDSDNHDRVMAS